MDRVLSARIDEAWVHRLAELARKLKVTKKEILERALALFAAKIEAEKGGDPFQETCGAWNRPGTPDELVAQGREAFRRSMRRHER
jgi:uncharacterized membrane protein